jgi:hypothetical protein
MVRMLFRHCTALEIAIHHAIHTCETPSAAYQILEDARDMAVTWV